MDTIQKRILEEVADLHEVPEGAYNIRANGQSAGRRSTANIEITPKPEGNGIDVRIKPVSFLVSFAATIVFTLLTNALMRPRLEKINMAESLKSVE